MENRTTRKIDIDTTSVLSFTQKPSIKSCKQKENWRWGNNKHQWNSLIDGVFIYMTAQNVNIQSSRSHIRRRHAYTILGNKSHQLQLWWCICCYYCCSDSLHEIVCAHQIYSWNGQHRTIRQCCVSFRKSARALTEDCTLITMGRGTKWVLDWPLLPP